MVEASSTYTLQLTLTYLHCIQVGYRKTQQYCDDNYFINIQVQVEFIQS